jgi:class 3 adenylate cyclase
VDSTLLTQYLGVPLATRNGREVKHTGDGIMASFISSAAAVRCAARIQRDLAQRRQYKRGHQLKVRIGGAAGEPVEHEYDIFGSRVQLAARLCSHAEPDQILVSSVVAELCMGKGLTFRSKASSSLSEFTRWN